MTAFTLANAVRRTPTPDDVERLARLFVHRYGLVETPSGRVFRTDQGKAVQMMPATLDSRLRLDLDVFEMPLARFDALKSAVLALAHREAP